MGSGILPSVQAYPRPSLVELEAVIDLMCSGNLTCQPGWPDWETWKFMGGRAMMFTTQISLTKSSILFMCDIEWRP